MNEQELIRLLRKEFKEELESSGERYPVEIMELLDTFDRAVIKATYRPESENKRQSEEC